MLSGAQEALCHPISTRCCFFIEAICCEARSSGTMHGQHLWTLWAMESPQLWAQWSGHLFMSTAVNCFHILQTHKYYTLHPTKTRHLGSSCASTCQATKTQSSLFDGHQSAWCASYEIAHVCHEKNWQKLNVCVDA